MKLDDDAFVRLLEHGFDARMAQPGWEPAYRETLYALKARLDGTLGGLRNAGRVLWTRSPDNPLLPLLADLGVDRETLFHILNGAVTKDESVERARARLEDDPALRSGLDEAVSAIAEQLAPAFDRAREDVPQPWRRPRTGCRRRQTRRPPRSRR